MFSIGRPRGIDRIVEFFIAFAQILLAYISVVLLLSTGRVLQAKGYQFQFYFFEVVVEIEEFQFLLHNNGSIAHD